MTESKKASVKAQVESDIQELCRRQNPDGSFGLWKQGESDRWPFVSIQVARALNQAREKDHAVPDNVLHLAKSYLKNIEANIPAKDYGAETRRSMIAYALYVRYLMKDVDAPAARKLIHSALASYGAKSNDSRRARFLAKGDASTVSQQDKLCRVLSLESMGWLLPVVSNDKMSATDAVLLRQVIMTHIKETASNADVVDDSYGQDDYLLFYSHTRPNAVILESLIIDQPKNDVIPKLATSLLAHRKAGCWDSTQENSSVLIALDRYFSVYEKSTPDFLARTWLGQQFVGENKFAGRSTETRLVTVPMRYLESHMNDKDVLLSKDGPGRLYYRIALNYAPKNLMLPAYDNGFAVTRTYEAVDDPKDVSRDAAGAWHVKAGATVRVKIAFSAPASRYHVALTDPLPAGMEAVNAELKGARDFHKTTSGNDGSDNQNESVDDSAGDYVNGRSINSYLWFPWWTQYWFEHQNLRDFRAEAFASVLYGGKYDYSYLARATTPGEYMAPPTKVEEMYAPETFGRAAAERVIVE